MSTYRACYWQSPDGQSEIVLTLPEHETMPDSVLLEMAVTEAMNACIAAHDAARCDDALMSYNALRAGLRIGPWTN